MRVFLLILFLLGSSGFVFAAEATNTVTGHVLKVLPLLLDKQGQDSDSPSLFDRDVYQMQLREHTNEISGVRIDVQWKASKSPDENLKIRVEARGGGTNGVPQLKIFETPVTRSFFSTWSGFTLAGNAYKKFGPLVAWRATLWNGDVLLSEQKSFLW